MAIVIRNARLVCPLSGLDGPGDIVVDGDCIARVTPPKGAATGGLDTVIDAGGLVAAPGFTDIHVHLREPGGEHKETMETGTAAAARGGFTTVCAMPNTSPVNDSARTTAWICKRAALSARVRVLPVAAVTTGLLGLFLTDFEALKMAGAVALSDDGRPVADAALMLAALKKAKEAGLVIASHSEEPSLSANGAVNEGPVSAILGVSGIPWAAETVAVARDVALCELTGARLHVCHVSREQTVEVIRLAKSRGVPVTAETAPHYFSLTDRAVLEKGALAKMNPPLGTERDRQAVVRGLADGTLDTIATDHAPHAAADKDCGVDKAAFGIVGLETALPLCLALVRQGALTLTQLVAKLTVNPAKAYGLPHQGIAPGAPADLVLFDPEVDVTVSAEKFASKGRNTPFDGVSLKGEVRFTLFNGRVVFGTLPEGSSNGR